jgi:hypothetical protein
MMVRRIKYAQTPQQRVIPRTLQGKLRPLRMLISNATTNLLRCRFCYAVARLEGTGGTSCDWRRLTPDSIEEGTSTRSIRDYDNIE